MPEVPAALKNCSTDDCIAALLYLGWTHEEIAAATNVSKGTVQNRRKQLEGGNLHPPPEAFDFIWKRERELHRLARNSNLSPDGLGTEVADRMEAIADLEVLDIGPDGDISYEELVAFAVLIAGQGDDFTPKEVVKRLAPMAILVDYPSELSESVPDSSKLFQTGIFEPNEGVPEENLLSDDDLTQAQPSVGNTLDKPSYSPKDNIDEQSWDLQGSKDYDNEPLDRTQPADGATQTSKSPSPNGEIIDYSMNPEECRSHGGSYDEIIGVCKLPSKWSGNDRQ